MNKLFKPASLLLCLLALLVFFMLGAAAAGLSGVAKGQGLAGGAIVLGYGVLFAIGALIAAVFMVYNVAHAKIVRANQILALLLAVLIAGLTFRFVTRDRNKKSSTNIPNYTAKPIATEVALPLDRQTAVNDEANSQRLATENTGAASAGTPMGLGFFAPRFYETPVLYFYGNPNLKKTLQEHVPIDSMLFKRLERGGFDIAYAPPWLSPDHMKLDYDFLYFRVQSIGRDFLEVTVNPHTQKTIYVNRAAGNLVYWPDFLLNVHSVEFITPEKQNVYIKPLSHASTENTPFQFMRPIMIKGDWMLVELQDGGFKAVGKGWIRWQKDGNLLISYSLLS